MTDDKDDRDKIDAKGGQLAVAAVTAIQGREFDQLETLLDSMSPDETRAAAVALGSMLFGVLEVAHREGFVSLSPVEYVRKYGLRMAKYDEPDEEA